MIFDTLTNFMIFWGAGTAVAIIALTVCKGCCIKRLMGKPCGSVPGI